MERVKEITGGGDMERERMIVRVKLFKEPNAISSLYDRW